MTDGWRPGASLEKLRARAGLLAAIRGFFAARGVLEIETPVLGRATATAPQLQSLCVVSPDGGHVGYLQTSPEGFMKRLLAAGSGPIYQITRAFRAGEQGRLHNPEFTMLEWYRPGFGYHGLMTEVAELVGPLLGCPGPFPILTYRDLFLDRLGIDPFTARRNELERAIAATDLATGIDLGAMTETDACDLALDLLFSHAIQPRLGEQGPVFVCDFPARQAALSRLRQEHDGVLVAERFELFFNGIELANGYQELTDANEQRQRFAADLECRERLGLPRVAADERLCAALGAGLPECAGVALGLDRLLLCMSGSGTIDEVLAFSRTRL